MAIVTIRYCDYWHDIQGMEKALLQLEVVPQATSSAHREVQPSNWVMPVARSIYGIMV